LAPKQNLTVVVTNVDPIAYTAATTERTRAAVEDLATLQQIALLFGDFITGGLKVAGDPKFPIPPGAAGGPAAMTATIERAHTYLEIEPQDEKSPKPPTPDDPDLRAIANDFGRELKKYVEIPAAQVGELNKASRQI